jgi:hypothetical protein
VDRPQNAIERAGRKNGRHLVPEAVRFAELDPAQDGQFREPGATRLHRLVIAEDVEQAAAGANVAREVGVLGEGDRGQAELERAPAAGFHRTPVRVPRPLGVDV